MSSATQRTVEAVWRIESARWTASLARTMHDLGLAEDLAQDALIAALEQWPKSGVPDKPGAWLLAVARRHAAWWPCSWLIGVDYIDGRWPGVDLGNHRGRVA